MVTDTDLARRTDRRAGLGGADRRSRRGRGRRRLRREAGTARGRARGGVRDLDDLAGNVRRISAAVDAARAEGGLDRDPGLRRAAAGRPDPGLAGGRGRGRRGRAPPEVPHRRARGRTCSPHAATVAAWIDAALDRETPFKCTAGLHHAIRHRDHETGFEHHGFLNVLLATRLAFDGGDPAEVAQVLDDHYANDLVALARQSDLAGARRWFTSFGSCSVTRAARRPGRARVCSRRRP